MSSLDTALLVSLRQLRCLFLERVASRQFHLFCLTFRPWGDGGTHYRLFSGRKKQHRQVSRLQLFVCLFQPAPALPSSPPLLTLVFSPPSPARLTALPHRGIHPQKLTCILEPTRRRRRRSWRRRRGRRGRRSRVKKEFVSVLPRGSRAGPPPVWPQLTWEIGSHPTRPPEKLPACSHFFTTCSLFEKQIIKKSFAYSSNSSSESW